MRPEKVEPQLRVPLQPHPLDRVQDLLEEALTGTSPRSKNSIIKEALHLLGEI